MNDDDLKTPEPPADEASGSGDAASPPPPPPPPSAPATAPPPPPTGGPAPTGGKSENPNRTIMIILAYFGLLALIPFLAEKEDEEIRWHAKNGLALTIVEFCLFLGLMILGWVPVIGCVAAIASLLLCFGILALHVYLMIKSLDGQRIELPLAKDIAAKL